MKQLTILLLIIAGSAFAQTNEYTLPEGTLTLAEARRIALDNNPGVTRALKNIEAAQAVVQQARSLWYPTLTASAGYTRNAVDIQPDWNPTVRYKDSFNDVTAGLQAQWLLFDGFARQANVLSTKYAVEVTEQIHADVQRLLLDAVTTAFSQAQLALEAMAIAAQDLSFNRQLESDSQKRYDVGAIPEADLLNFSVRALQAEILFLKAERNYHIACTILAQLMAVPGSELVADQQPVRYSGMTTVALPTFESELAYALRHRPDLLALDAARSALQQQVRAKRGSYAPQIAAVAGVEYENRTDLSVNDMNNRESYVGLAATWDLFTGGRRPAQIRETIAQLAALEETYSEYILRIQSGIRQSLETARVAFETYQRSQQAYDLTVRIRESSEIL